jgi:hypothetical protein
MSPARFSILKMKRAQSFLLPMFLRGEKVNKSRKKFLIKINKKLTICPLPESSLIVNPFKKRGLKYSSQQVYGNMLTYGYTLKS